MASQIRAPVQSAVPIRSAVSGVMARLHRTISWMRCGGTRRRSAKGAALMPRLKLFLQDGAGMYRVEFSGFSHLAPQ
jgi:hypothetical protein